MDTQKFDEYFDSDLADYITQLSKGGVDPNNVRCPRFPEGKLEFFCPKTEELCCAFCLTKGHLKGQSFVSVSEAAQDMRKAIDRDLERLGQTRTRIELLANDLNRTHSQYQETYDHVESFVSDRFAAFRHQLMQKEVEIRKQLQGLRDVGDHTLTDTRAAFLRKLNAINLAGMTGRRLQNGGTDVDVLRNKSKMADLINTEVPGISGSGFHIADLGDLNLSGLLLTLDLNASLGTGVPNGTDTRAMISYNQNNPGDQFRYGTAPANSGGYGQASNGLGDTYQPPSPSQPQQRSASPPLRFTFGPEEHCTISENVEGIRLHCDENVQKQVGVRANQSFRELPHYPQDGGLIVWKIRLDRVLNSFLGVVDAEPQDDQPMGLHWRPMKNGEYDITVGRGTTALQSIPACRPGDVIKFTYDPSNGMLKVAINGLDRGIVATDVPTELAPACILSPGEVVTILRH